MECIKKGIEVDGLEEGQRNNFKQGNGWGKIFWQSKAWID